MRLKLTFTAFTLIILNSFTIPESTAQSKYLIRLHVSPAIPNRKLKTTDPKFNYARHFIESSEKPYAGKSIGFSLERIINNRISVGIGVDYSQVKEMATLTILEPTSRTHYESRIYNKYEYLGTPIYINYNFISKRKFHLGVKGQIAPQIFTKNSLTKYNGLNGVPFEWKYNRAATSASLGLYAEYSVKPIVIFVNPNYTRYLTPNAKYLYHNDGGGILIYSEGTKIKEFIFYKDISIGAKLML